jgi:hypothetical protein
MDAAGLTILLTELAADADVARDAATKATIRVSQDHPGHLEACAYELSRFYNILERMLERICQECENHLEPRGDYHERLLQRLTLELPGIRPAFLPRECLTQVRELKGFRHVMRHAYDLTLRMDRLSELSQIAESLAAELPNWCSEFGRKVRLEQGWSTP